MRLMRLVPESVEEKNVEALELAETFFGNVAEIGEIGDGSEAVAENFSLPVQHSYRIKTQPEQVQRTIEGVHFQLGQRAVFVSGIKNVLKHGAHKIGDVLTCVQRNAPFAVEAERTQIVNAQDMVGVSVRVEYGVDATNLFTNRLLAEVGCAVNQNRTVVVFNEERGTRAAVTRIGGVAHRAGAAIGGSAH